MKPNKELEKQLLIIFTKHVVCTPLEAQSTDHGIKNAADFFKHYGLITK